MKASPAEQMRWCSLGCSWEGTVAQLNEGACPKCGSAVVPLGWRYRSSKGVVEYASTFELLPKEVREVTAA